MSWNRILQFVVVYREEIDSVHRDRIDLELPYLRSVHKDTRQIESNWRKEVEIDETRLKVTSLVGGSQAAGRSHNSDPHTHTQLFLIFGVMALDKDPEVYSEVSPIPFTLD